METSTAQNGFLSIGNDTLSEMFGILLQNCNILHIDEYVN